MSEISHISICLWFNGEAEEAAKFYTEIFKNSAITHISRFGEAGREVHGGKPGAVQIVAFTLNGQQFMALNGGPGDKFNQAISLQVNCDTQEEIDHYWEKLREGGDPTAQQCGWLKDKYGLFWQVLPANIAEMMSDPDQAKCDSLMNAIHGMQKLEIDKLQQAYEAKD